MTAPFRMLRLKVKCSPKISGVRRYTGNQLDPLMARVKRALRDKSAVGKLKVFFASVFTAEDIREISTPDPIFVANKERSEISQKKIHTSIRSNRLCEKLTCHPGWMAFSQKP